jgi:PelA/Pel-15E family pectate lyase
MTRIYASLLVAVFGSMLAPDTTAWQKTTATASIKWKDCLTQKPEWYGGNDAVRIVENVLLYQRASGGWPKNIEMAAVLTEKQKTEMVRQKQTSDSTIDNEATYTQMIFLAKVFNLTKRARFRESFVEGLDYLLEAQYANGGWPQFYPDLKGYYKHITFNDDAMIGVMSLLREIARTQPPFAFVDEERRAKADSAVEKGIACILKCQVIADGKRTVWCAQHDETTLAPAPARSYEKISLSGGESVGIVRFLMGIDHPSLAVIEAIQAAVAWFEQVKLTGIKLIEKRDRSLAKGYDRVVVQDLKAEPLWGRFYEIGTNRPIFCGRDGVIKYSLAEIEYERRTGYRWYVSDPVKLLARDYPSWTKKWSIVHPVGGGPPWRPNDTKYP